MVDQVESYRTEAGYGTHLPWSNLLSRSQPKTRCRDAWFAVSETCSVNKTLSDPERRPGRAGSHQGGVGGCFKFT